MNVHYDKEMISDIDKAVTMYGEKEFQSPTRSTVPLLSWLKYEQTMLRLLLRDMGIPADCNLHLEYTVSPQQGKGVASHTDVMVISGESSLAVEAKWTEPRYETVGEWLEKGSNPLNRRDVLTGWLGLLQQHAQRTIDIGDFSDIVYQMVHRAASACAAGVNPKMAYLMFEPSLDPKTASIQQIHADLNHLWDLLGNPNRFPFYLIELQLSPTAAFDAIASLPKGDEATNKAVRDALCNEPLFDFSEYELRTVNGGYAG
jgi:hypothetical protein